MSDLPEPIPAASLIVMRLGAGPAPEILMIERSEAMAFAAGALAFPGGRIDPHDKELGARFEPLDAAARIAAIRETIEETGIAIGLMPTPSQEAVVTIRAGLATGIAFGDLLEAAGLDLDRQALTPFARWCPNFRETRRFDTYFYLAGVSPDSHPAEADQAETARAFWVTAAQILDDIDSARAQAIFPTRRNLERLAGFATLDQARADAARHPVRKITPWVEEREGRKWVCIPEGIGYPVTAEPLETARRS